MNKWIMLLWIPSVLMAGGRTKEALHALAYGAEACAVLRIVDDEMVVVTNATVVGNFHMNDGKGNPFTGRTDTNGIYVAAGTCIGDWHYAVNKVGYY